MSESARPLAVVEGLPEPATSWLPIALEPIVRGITSGEIIGPVPKLLERSDGVRLLYPGEVHSLAGEPETGKGWIALHAAGATLARGLEVLYLDFEDAPASITSRLLALQVAPALIVERFAYVRPADPLTSGALPLLLNRREYALAIVDGLSEAYALLGLDPYSNTDAAKFLATLARPIAATGAAVLLIDHVVKSRENRGRYALGAQHKLAGIAAAYSTEAITPPSRTRAGQIKLRVEKDRHGHVRSHAEAGQIALVHVTPDDEGQRVTVLLEPPTASTSDTGEFRPTVLMRRVWDYVEAEPGAIRNDIRDGVTGRTKWIDEALRLLIAEGYIERRRKDGRTYAHHVLKPFNETGPNGTEPGPGPDLGIGTPVPPLKGTGPGPNPNAAANRVPLEGIQ